MFYENILYAFVIKSLHLGRRRTNFNPTELNIPERVHFGMTTQLLNILTNSQIIQKSI